MVGNSIRHKWDAITNIVIDYKSYTIVCPLVRGANPPGTLFNTTYTSVYLAPHVIVRAKTGYGGIKVMISTLWSEQSSLAFPWLKYLIQ